MNRFHYVTGFILVIILAISPRIEAKGFTYSATVRNSDGEALPNADVSLFLEILDDASSASSLYEERHSTTSDENGFISIIVGEGFDNSASIESLDWSKTMFLRVSAAINGGTMQLLGTTSILGVPTAFHAEKTSNLVTTASDGTQWSLQVNNAGDVYWHKVVQSQEEEQEPAYDKEKIPNTLYLQGNMVDNWNPAKGIAFTRVASGRFTLNQYLEKGNIFKFTSVASWEASVDWSGTSSEIGTASPLKEWGNTPEFQGEAGYYVLIVDFNTFTLTINKK